MTTSIIWIVGISAAGKETFIRSVSHNASLAARFGWEGKRIAASQESLRYLAQFPTDPITKNRERILSEVPILALANDVILLKWQFVDTEARRPERLQALLPDANHSIIVLHAPITELNARLPRKAWWDDWGSPTFASSELSRVEDAITSLSARFPVRHLRSGADDGYRPYNLSDRQLTSV